jgi:hypothetical protein
LEKKIQIFIKKLELRLLLNLKSLACLVYFVIHCYANMWFCIKTRPKDTEAARLTLESMGFLMQLPEEERAIGLPVFERGL